MKKLLERQDRFAPRGVVRSDKSAGQLRGYGATDQQLFVGDILREGGEGVLKRAMEGADALVRGWPLCCGEGHYVVVCGMGRVRGGSIGRGGEACSRP